MIYFAFKHSWIGYMQTTLLALISYVPIFRNFSFPFCVPSSLHCIEIKKIQAWLKCTYICFRIESEGTSEKGEKKWNVEKALVAFTEKKRGIYLWVSRTRFDLQILSLWRLFPYRCATTVEKRWLWTNLPIYFSTCLEWIWTSRASLMMILQLDGDVLLVDMNYKPLCVYKTWNSHIHLPINMDVDWSRWKWNFYSFLC